MNILKNIFLLITASILFVLAFAFITIGFQHLMQFQNLIMNELDKVFAKDYIGNLLKGILGLLIIPLGVGFIVEFIYYIFKRSIMPYLAHFIWVIWLILAVASICK